MVVAGRICVTLNKNTAKRPLYYTKLPKYSHISRLLHNICIQVNANAATRDVKCWCDCYVIVVAALHLRQLVLIRHLIDSAASALHLLWRLPPWPPEQSICAAT